MKKQTKTKTTKTKKAITATTRPRSKAAKISMLKRSAAGKARWHRMRHKKMGVRHLSMAAILALFMIVSAGAILAHAGSLLGSSSVDANALARAAKKDPPPPPPADQIGTASWYAIGLPAPDALTCASTRFPRGTYLQVTDMRNHRQVVCLVNDYGPTPGTNRVVDLSRGSYQQLEGLGSGTMPVEIRVVPHP